MKRIHPTVLLMAGAHFMVDAYGNIYAPLLPLLIPKLHLSLAAAGTLTMLYQMAASVAQVGFGHLADRWRPVRVDVGTLGLGNVLSVDERLQFAERTLGPFRAGARAKRYFGVTIAAQPPPGARCTFSFWPADTGTTARV